MKALSGLFAAGVAMRNSLYDRGALPSKRLKAPVISVGNLSVGGSGKTPFIMLLGELLAKHGIRFDVLSRGYGRAIRGVAVVDPKGEARQFGDEPLLIARKLGVPVVVGEDRYRAGLLAEKQFGSEMHLLDDGFQHRGLARDFDIVLVTPDDARDRLLPVGRLREPPSSLRRADAIVLTSGAAAESFPVEGKTLWRVRRGIVLGNLSTRPVAFCGIARPQNFFLQLSKAKVETVAEAVFQDHHSYTERDVRDLLELSVRSEADGFITTEKDAINLGPLLARLEPVSVVPVRMALEDASSVVDAMLAVIAQRHDASGGVAAADVRESSRTSGNLTPR